MHFLPVFNSNLLRNLSVFSMPMMEYRSSSMKRSYVVFVYEVCIIINILVPINFTARVHEGKGSAIN